MEPELLECSGRGTASRFSARGHGILPDWRRMRSYSGRGGGLLAAWWLAMLSLAGPTWRPEPSPFADDPVPVMLVLKASETMDLLAHLAPSRMERARLKTADFAAERSGQPLGLVAYAGSAHCLATDPRHFGGGNDGGGNQSGDHAQAR